MTATLTLDIPRDYWLSMNRQIPNHAYRRRLIESIHELTVAAATRQGLDAIPTPCAVTWTVRYPKGVGEQADAVNAAPTTKACLDALVPRWIAGDSRRFVASETFRRGENLGARGGHQIVARFEEVARP